MNDTEYCMFCGETEKRCHGGGFEDGVQAHDFTPGGIPKESV